MGLFWVAFVEWALQGFLDASANVTFRLPKADPWINALIVEVSTHDALTKKRT
jgi:hypothetical protein